MRFLISFVVAVMLLLPSSGWCKIGGGDIVFHTKGIANVTYSHDYHVGKLGLKCMECHFRIYVMSVKANRSYTMAEMQQGKSCGTCHNGKRAFSVKDSCVRCHR
jgi:c(7)-type cytochrome triheme protein